MNIFKRQGFIKPRNTHLRETQVDQAPEKEEMHRYKGKKTQTCTDALKNAGQKEGGKKIYPEDLPI